MPQPVLLLGADPVAYGIPLERIAETRPVILVDSAAPGWARPFLSGHLPADPTHEARTAEAIARYADGQPVAGVLTWTRAHLRTAARITGYLGLPGLSYETAGACTDPATSKALLARHRLTADGPGDLDGALVSAETVVLDDEVRIAALTRTTPGAPGACRCATRSTRTTACCTTASCGRRSSGRSGRWGSRTPSRTWDCD
ncbi:hypothetical protein ACQ4WX_16740 [Streptomyces lasalocidi]